MKLLMITIRIIYYMKSEFTNNIIWNTIDEVFSKDFFIIILEDTLDDTVK